MLANSISEEEHKLIASDRSFITPRAKLLAKKLNIDSFAEIEGTGKNNRITEKDINLFISEDDIFKKFGAIPVDRKGNSGQYDSVVQELFKRDSFLLIITPEGRFDATRFRSSFLYLAKELEAEVMPVQIDYEHDTLQFLNSLNLDGSEEEVIQRLRFCFDGVKGRKSRFKA